jgi:hypothetical protein
MASAPLVAGAAVVAPPASRPHKADMGSVFLLGCGVKRRGRLILTGALVLALSACGAAFRTAEQVVTGVRPPSLSQEREAKAAWRYFQKARSPETGLVEVSAGSGFTTPATLGDQLIASVSARRLGVINRREFDASVSDVLGFLGRMELSQGKLPGVSYSGRTGRLVRLPSTVADPGWSAVELGRLLTGLRILVEDSPNYRAFVANNLARWNVCAAVQDGVLQRSRGEETIADLGTGWYDYAAQGFRYWGKAVSPAPTASGSASIDLYGITFPVADDPAKAEPLLTLPLALLGLEANWRSPLGGVLSAEQALFARLVQAQERRTEATGLLTARSSFRRASSPYVVTDAVLQLGYGWSTAEAGGRGYPELALTSTAASFATDAITASAAFARARASVATLFDPDRGWFEGRYELSGAHETTRTSSTNAVVLETLLRLNGGMPDLTGTPVAHVAERRNPTGELECRLPALRATAGGPER